MAANISENTDASRFELTENGATAYADYRLDGRTLSILYVFAPDVLRGTGAAGRLMEGIVTIARERNLEIRPVCGHAVSWLRRHKA